MCRLRRIHIVSLAEGVTDKACNGVKFLRQTVRGVFFGLFGIVFPLNGWKVRKTNKTRRKLLTSSDKIFFRIKNLRRI